MMHVRVTDNYQIEIPKSIIKALNIKIGDNLLIYKDKEVIFWKCNMHIWKV